MENNQEHHARFLAPFVEVAVNVSSENLRSAAVAQLERIATYQGLIVTLSDSINVDELMQRYKARKSYFATAAEWFGKQYLAVKIILGVAIIGAIYFLSLSYILIGITYVAIAFLMENHYQTTQEQEELIEEDLLHLKQSLVDSINHLDGVNDIIQQTFTSLYQLTSQMETINSRLEENNANLLSQVIQFKEVVLALENNKKDLVESTATLKGQLQAAYTKIHRHEEEMSTNALSISESDRRLGETCVGFKTSLEKFDEFSREQQASIIEYDRLSSKLKEKIAEYEAALLELSKNQHVTYSESAIDIQIDVDQSIRESELLCDRLEQEIANKIHIKHFVQNHNDDELVEKRRTLSCSW